MIRNSNDQNLWGIIRDQEEVLIAPKDTSGNPVGFLVSDPYQIEILGNIILSTWSKGQKYN